ncbi:putative ADP,ATP carrier protein [Hibiscus syriacus]|uniref:ADP/ATP translocase n=1 Tax=Hibiscus syriacus TaxID=106335 RepID=A0A6A2X828_HIBSY|nr:putative ADP,ATP carrier protein [Hibiscus syriacus]
MSKEEVENRGGRGLKPTSRPYEWLASFHRDLLAGAVMGCVVHTIVAPIERAKLLLQTQDSNLALVRRKFKRMLDCIVRTVREEGILSVWRGNGSSVLRYYPSVALNFSLEINAVILPIEASANFVAGAAAGCTTLILIYPLDIAHTRLAADIGRTNAVTTSAGLLPYPLDTVRRRMMMQSGLEQPMYRSTLDCWRTIYRTEGVTSFHRGALSNIFRSTGAAAILVLYDEVKKFMDWGVL